MTYCVVKPNGKTVIKVMRNCDRVCNIQDAKGKFRKAHGDPANFWKCLAEWLLTEAKEEENV